MKNIYIALFVLTFVLPTYATEKSLIKNFSKVSDGIFRGARLSSFEAVEYLKNGNIKNIINLQGGDLNSKLAPIIPWTEPGERPEVIAKEKTNAEALGMGYIHAPLNSLGSITKEENESIDEVLAFMHEESNRPLFIHCEHGADRTGLVVALYRVKYEGVPVETAKAEWIKNGHNKLHQLFTGKLDKYFAMKVKEFSNEASTDELNETQTQSIPPHMIVEQAS